MLQFCRNRLKLEQNSRALSLLLVENYIYFIDLLLVILSNVKQNNM